MDEHNFNNLEGKLLDEPEVLAFNNKTKSLLFRFCLLSDSKFLSREKRGVTCIDCLGNTNKDVFKKLRKGDEVKCSGRPMMISYENKKGEEGFKPEIVYTDFQNI